MALPPHTPLVLLAAIVASGVAFFAWLFRDTPGARPLVVFMLAASLWSLAEGIALASPTLPGKAFWTKVAWSVSAVGALAWFATVLAYADHEWRLTRRRLALLLVEPAAFLSLVWTNERHNLVAADFSTEISSGYLVLTREVGLAFWAHVGYSYLLILVSAVIIVRMNLRTTHVFRSQGTALLVAIFVPLLANALTIFGFVPPFFDLTSIGFVFTGIVIAAAIFRGKLLSVAPATRELGRDAVVDELSDQIVIVNEDGNVVDLNPPAERLFDVDTEAVVGESLASVNESLAATAMDDRTTSTELEIEAIDGVHFYDVRISSLYRAYGAVTGRVISLRDVTNRRQREQRLDVLNRLLRHNLRNEMNVIRGNVELLKDDFTDTADVEKRFRRIQATVDAVIGRSNKVGNLAQSLDQSQSRPVDVSTMVSDVAASVHERYPDATVTVDVPEGLAVTASSSLELAIEEVVVNAIEHTDTQSPTVSVTAGSTDDGYVELGFDDDGPGIPEQERVVIEAGRETAMEHGSGIGLWLVAWVVREFGGTVTFEGPDDGTTVVLRLPEATEQGADTVNPTADVSPP